ncbi:hypothetical protein SMJ63A_80074 [Stenotrophomonas geniculata]
MPNTKASSTPGPRTGSLPLAISTYSSRPSVVKPTSGERSVSSSGSRPISTSAMPAMEPSSAARGSARVTASPKNDSTNLSTPMMTSAAMPSCQVAMPAACGSMPCCLKARKAGPSTSSAMPMLVGASRPSGMAVTSSRPVRAASRRAIRVYSRLPTSTPKAVPGNMRPNTTSAGNWKIPTRAMAMKPRMERLSTTRPKKPLKSPETNQRRGAAEAGADMEGVVGVGIADGRPSGARAPIPRWNDGFQPTAGPLVAGLVADSGPQGVGRAGRLRRGRCKYVPVSSVAASMRLTPLRSLPARPLTVSCACQPRKRIKRSKAKAGSLCRAEPMLGCCTRSLSAEHGSALQKIIPIILSFIHAWRGSTVSTKVDTHQCNIPFRQIAGSCRRRGGSGCGGVRGMDAAAKPPGTGLRRRPQPDPPRHPQETRFCSGSGS